MFRALILEKNPDGLAEAHVRDLDDDALPQGEVTVAVEFSTLNYKDGLCLSPNGGGLVRTYPHIAGIDFAGTVEASDDVRYRPGDKVVLTGWRVGEVHWGGYSSKAQVKADMLVPLPAALTTRQSMAVGTAGLTAMLAVQALEDHGLTPAKGEVLVTGAAGGVGSVAVAILAQLGYQVVAVTGRAETHDYLASLGASRIIARDDINETVKRPLEAETWAGCVDAVGGAMLARVSDEIRRLCCCSWFGRRIRVAHYGHSILAAGRQPFGHRQRDETLCGSSTRLGADRHGSAIGEIRVHGAHGNSGRPAAAWGFNLEGRGPRAGCCRRTDLIKFED